MQQFVILDHWLLQSPPLCPNKIAKEGGSASPTLVYTAGRACAAATKKQSYPTPKITILYGVDNKPVGWMFAAFYHDLRDFIKCLNQ